MSETRDRKAAATGQRPILALAVTLALVCLAGWLFKAHCTLTGGWVDDIQYTTGCYSDAVPFWHGRGVAAGRLPYFDTRLEYPVLTGAAIWIEGGITRWAFGAGADAGDFLTVVTLVNALLAGMVLWMSYRAGMPRERLRAWVLAPPLILYLGHNWDMLAIAFALGAMLLARRGRIAGAAGVAGLGVAAKLFPILLLPLLGLGALFGQGRGWKRRFLAATIVSASAVAAWLAVNLPVALAAFHNWSEFYRFSTDRSGTAASVWEILSYNHIWPTATPERNLVSAITFLIGAAAILALGWRRHRDHLWTLFAPLLAWFLLASKVYSPQFDLWLYPVLLLTLPRLSPLLLFVIGDIACYFAEFWMFAGSDGAWPSVSESGLAAAALFRAVAMLWIIAVAVREAPPPWLIAAPGDAAE